MITRLLILCSDLIFLNTSKKSFRTVGSPPVILIFETPSFVKAATRLDISSRFKNPGLFSTLKYPLGRQYPHLKLHTSVMDKRIYGKDLPKLSDILFIVKIITYLNIFNNAICLKNFIPHSQSDKQY